MHVCNFCGKELRNAGALMMHQNSCKLNPNRIIRTRNHKAGCKKGCTPWNKGKTGLQEAWNKGLICPGTGKAKSPEDEELRKKRISDSMIGKYGGYREGSGRGKKGWYHGIYCDSSYELAYVIYNLEHGINIHRCSEVRSYEHDGKTFKYHPDFEVDGRIVEIKGYDSPQWQSKFKCNPDIVVMFEDDLTHVFEYVIGKYGKDFISLYEDR